MLEPLLQKLFAAFGIVDSAENEYVMKCVMRVVDFVGPKVHSPDFSDELSALPCCGLS